MAMASGSCGDHGREARMRNLRFFIAYWELERLLPVDADDEGSDAAWQRRLFREELAGFQELVANSVSHEGVMVHARASLRLAWKDCVGHAADENWARLGPEDARVGVLSDLQQVAPGLWIGSTATLTDVERLAERDIQHAVYCATTTRETRMVREGSSSRWSNHVVSLFELPRQQVEDALAQVDGVDQLVALSCRSCRELCRIAFEINDLIGSRAQGESPGPPGDGGVLLYCDSGISSSIALCAAVLMARYKLPLAVAMPLIQAARRDVLPSKHLSVQLEQLQLQLGLDREE
jgi:hypothetical protein